MKMLRISGLIVALTLAACFRSGVPQEISQQSSSPMQQSGELVAQTLTVTAQYARGAFSRERTLLLPPGFRMSVFAAGMRQPRSMTFDDRGVMYLTDKAGSVVRLDDGDGDAVVESIVTIVDSLQNPHGIEWFEEELYVGLEDRVIAISKVGSATQAVRTITPLPSGGVHVTRTVRIGPDRKLYVSAGSTCNVCEERDERRAAITRYNLDGSGEEVYAKGLRNSVGMIFHEGELWAVENGSDMRGDDVPPEEVNIVEAGKHYGWPYCFGDRQIDPTHTERAEFCQTTQPPRFLLQAHSAPLGLRFLTQSHAWPEEYHRNLFISYHGSWNRSVPTGYKIVRIPEGEREPVDFITGWLQPDGTSWGRPVDVIFGPDGALYITDDKAGAVYRVWYEGNST